MYTTTRLRHRAWRQLVPILLVAAATLTALSPSPACAGHWNDFLRYLGWGWSDGYHACPQCGPIPASSHGHFGGAPHPLPATSPELVPATSPELVPHLVPGSIYGIR